MARISNKRELLKYYADAHDQHFKVAGLLLAAHGGSLGTCITILKDTASTPQFMGIGALFILFGVGLIASILYYVSVFMIRSTVRNALMSDQDPNDEPNASLLKGLNVISISVAVVTLIAAIGLVIWKSTSL